MSSTRRSGVEATVTAGLADPRAAVPGPESDVVDRTSAHPGLDRIEKS